MAYLLSHGRVKPPLAAGQVDWSHPFVRKLLFGAWFNEATSRFMLPTWGRTPPRSLSHNLSSATLSANAEGRCTDLPAPDFLDWGADPIPAAQVTICLIRKKTDTTNRNPGTAFCSATATVAEFCSANLPFSDGTTYWNFGGTTAGTTRLSIAGLSYSTVIPERWIFIAGSRGMAIWRNGVKVASHATANPGRTVNPVTAFHVNARSAIAGQQGDAQQFNLFMALDEQWDDALCRWWSAEPYAHLYGSGVWPRSFPILIAEPEPEPEQTFEDGGVSHPLTWITLTKKDGSKHPYSEVDLNDPEDYYDGYKRPRVERFLTIARGLSDRDGQIEHMSFGAVLSDIATDRFDSDREFRGTLADAINKYLTNRPLEVWFIDDVERRQLGLARLAAVGYVNDYAPTADLHFEVKGADWLKKKFSRKRRAQQSWQPLITAADFPDCPDETLNSPAPLIYGSLGLGGAEAVTGVAVTVNPQPTAAPASFALSLQAGGRLAGVTRYYKVSGIVGGQETIQAGPLVATTTDTNKTIRLTWTAVPSATAIYVYSSSRPDFLSFAYTKLAGGATTYDDDTTPPNQEKRWLEGTDWLLGLRINLQYYVYANLGGGLFSEPGQAGVTIPPNPPKTPASDLDRDIDITWSAHAGASGGYRIIRRRSYYSDWDAVFDRQWDVAAGVLTVTDDLITTTAVTMPTGELIAAEAAGQAEAIFVGIGSYGDPTPQTLSALLVARHACARLGKIYIPQTIANVDGEDTTTYTPVPESAFGVTWFAPDHPGWIYPEKYVEINGQWFTLIFTTVEPLPDKVLVDVDGIEPNADGTGDALRSLVDQRLHFMNNFVAPDPAWASGPYLTAADTVFPHIPAIPLVDEASHALVKAQLAARLVSGDYEGAMILGADGEFITAVDALARFQLSGDFDQTFNRKGQDMVTCEPIEAGDDLPTITDVLSIREGSFNLVDQVQSAFFNIIPYVHSRDYTGRERTGWYGNNEIRSEDSILNYDQEREAPVFELHAGRANTPQGSATIADVMARKLARYQDPRRIGSLQMPFEGLEYEPGSTAAITHLEGIGANGWSGREVRFIRHEVEPTEGIVRLDFYDLTAVLENHETLRRRREGGS